MTDPAEKDNLTLDPATAPVVATVGIRKSFGGVEVLKGIDLEASGGSVVALLGENGAGKSTLVKIIVGDYTPSAGSIVVDGVAHSALTPVESRAAGISMIAQEFNDAPTLSVAENISLGRIPHRYGVVNWREVDRRAREVLSSLEAHVDIGADVSSLTVGERQFVEIARAMSNDARVLILDEPTAALSHHEAEVLFSRIRRLRDQGKAIIYITHRLDEVFAISDRVHVLRDGDTALQADTDAVDRDQLVGAMVGRYDLGKGRPAMSEVPVGEVALRWQGASSHRQFSDIDIEVRRGEVVALYGKLGSGALEVGRSAFGLEPIDAGSLEVGGEVVDLTNPVDAVALGIGFLSEDRKVGGAFSSRPVGENVAVASWPRLATAGLLTADVEQNALDRWFDRLAIRSSGKSGQPMEELSGGNQQKVLVARWLERHANALVLLEPTRGVDVGARADLYGVLRQLASEGAAIMIVTSDYEEVVAVADRSYVIAKGRTTAELEGDDITMNALLAHAGG
ncbi:MAG: sugar ABC transporter ATP-binding protein [Acidimicrobiia bacterium]|nr:sugar ABC transporter ATP-binding protein [Acidimicrobiia bacterium]